MRGAAVNAPRGRHRPRRGRRSRPCRTRGAGRSVAGLRRALGRRAILRPSRRNRPRRRAGNGARGARGVKRSADVRGHSADIRPLRRPPYPATHAISLCPRRLGWPRTLAFHAGNVGSNPAGDARAFAALTGSWTIARASNLPCSDAWGTYRVTCGCGPRCGSVREPLNCRMQEIGHCVRVALRHAVAGVAE